MQGNLYPMMKAEGEEKEKLAKETVAAIEKEIEPLLANAGPFFGGKDKPTLAEVCFTVDRMDDYSTDLRYRLSSLPS